MLPLWSAIYWTIALLLGFLSVELYAAKSRAPGDTFSEFTWDIFGVKKPRPFGLLRRIILGSFLGALYFHLVFGTTVLPVAVLAFPLAGVILYWAARESPFALEGIDMAKFWQKAKAVVIPLVTSGLALAAQGTFGPKGVVIATALGALWGVFSKRPQDSHEPEAK